jgi:hypothetical protein
MTSPYLYSESLHKAMDSFDSKASVRGAHLDAVSNDIKELEKRLLNHVIAKSFAYEVGPCEYLQWNVSSKRLCYKSPGCYKPLIETKISVRERVHPKLVDFFTALMDKTYGDNT